MASLQFTKKDNGMYASDVTINANFNIHLERVKSGTIEIWLSTVAGGLKGKVFEKYVPDEVFDHDFDSLVYPKHLTIVSSSKVTNGVITEV